MKWQKGDTDRTLDPNACKLYAGIAGVDLPIEDFPLGSGLELSKTYMHLMAPFLAAFTPAEPGKPHPAPWKAVSGGMGFDISGQLYIPLDFNLPEWFDRLNTVWWIIALLRLKASSLATVPVLANMPFTAIPSLKPEPHFWPMEVHLHRLIPEYEPPQVMTEEALVWVRNYWMSAGRLMRHNKEFYAAFRAVDECIWSSTPALALVSLWGGLERLFSPYKDELTFRISSMIAAYLEPIGTERIACYKTVKRLYGNRSSAAHGVGCKDAEPFVETYCLARRVLIKMIEENHVPTHHDLEGRLFGSVI